MQILLAEDDQFYAHNIKDLLVDQGIKVDVVNSTQDALKRYSKRYGAVILDSMLPNNPRLSGLSQRDTQAGFRSGICVAREIRRKNSEARIVMLSADPVGTGAAEWCAKSNVPCISKSEGPFALLGSLERVGLLSEIQTPSSFIVHGHDEAALRELKSYILQQLRWQPPIILREQPSAGKTIIEKFEFNACRVDCVFVLLTPDDATPKTWIADTGRRSRQNVIFELGFFYGKMSRTSGRIFLLYKGDVELPSDIRGIVWIDITNGLEQADAEIKAELKAAKLLGGRPRTLQPTKSN